MSTRMSNPPLDAQCPRQPCTTAPPPISPLVDGSPRSSHIQTREVAARSGSTPDPRPQALALSDCGRHGLWPLPPLCLQHELNRPVLLCVALGTTCHLACLLCLSRGRGGSVLALPKTHWETFVSLAFLRYNLKKKLWQKYTYHKIPSNHFKMYS